MSDKPSYSQAYSQRIQNILDSMKTSHNAPSQPVRNADIASGTEEKRIPGSYQLGS